MRKTEERILKNPVQINGLKEHGFYFERCGYADCKVPGDNNPAIRRTDIYKMMESFPGLTLIITDCGRDIFAVINSNCPHSHYPDSRYHRESERISKSQIVDFVVGYLKEYGYPVKKS